MPYFALVVSDTPFYNGLPALNEPTPELTILAHSQKLMELFPAPVILTGGDNGTGMSESIPDEVCTVDWDMAEIGEWSAIDVYEMLESLREIRLKWKELGKWDSDAFNYAQQISDQIAQLEQTLI